MKRIITIFLISLIVFFSSCLGAAAIESRVFDQANLLKPDQIEKLEKRACDFAAQHQLDMVLVTTDQAKGKTARAYADDFYDERGFGIGPNKCGLLFLIDMDNREIYISTAGRAIKIFTDTRIEQILDRQYPEIKNGNYYATFNTAIDFSSNLASADLGAREPKALQRWVLALLAGCGLGGLVTFIVWRPYRKKYIAVDPSRHINCKLALTNKDDRLVNTSVSSRIIESSSNRSSTHRSSSGRTHGGGGRRF